MKSQEKMIALNEELCAELQKEIRDDKAMVKKILADAEKLNLGIEEKQELLAETKRYVNLLKQSGKPRKKSANKSKKKNEASENEQPKNVNQEIALEESLTVVRENPGIEKQELYDLVADNLRSRETKLRGYDKRFAEAIEKGPFRVDTQDKVWLSEAENTEQNPVQELPLNGLSELAVES